MGYFFLGILFIFLGCNSQEANKEFDFLEVKKIPSDF